MDLQPSGKRARVTGGSGEVIARSAALYGGALQAGGGSPRFIHD